MRSTSGTAFRHYVTVALLVASVAGIMLGCGDSTPPDRSGTFFGPLTALASGNARTYVVLDGAGMPTDLGIALSEATLSGLPDVATEYVFALPSQAFPTAFKHAVINWMPQGHNPAIYALPHFDVHFYMITQAQREAILLGDSSLAAKMARQPGAEFVPSGYVTGMGAAQMGLHWNDPESPERKGAPFTKTFIYGSYDGGMTFAEPMMTKAYLDTKPIAVVTPVKLPASYAIHGYQATSYTITWDGNAREYRVALSGLVLR